MSIKVKTRFLGVYFLLLVGSFLQASATEIPSAKADDVGMSADNLAEVDKAMIKLVEEKKLAGGIVAIARKGKMVHFKSYGQMDLKAKKPMRNDTIVRIYSMSKAITSAAALTLFDDGKLELNAPVSKYLPELKGLKVYHKDGNVEPSREATVRDLMRHTAGMTYGFFGDSPVDKQYVQANVLDRDSDLTAMTKKLGDLPLLYEPGKDWVYSVSVDVLGRVVEVVSGKSLDEFFQRRIFDPLDMKDTSFFVPKDKLDRFAANYNSDGKGNLTLRDAPAASRYLKNPKLYSGGGGLVSTARDYMRFLMMIQSGGQLHGKRVLSKEAVYLMTHNQLPKAVEWIKFGDQVREGVGFGLGFSVRVKMSPWDPQGRVGEYGWGGAASTHYWVSPKDDLIVVTLEQIMPYSFLTEFAVKGLIYDAIEK